jgi:hypothetical protein
MQQIDHRADRARKEDSRAAREDDAIVTTRPLTADGRVLPPGSQGVIIDVSPVPGHYSAGFASPFHCIVGIDAGDFDVARPGGALHRPP